MRNVLTLIAVAALASACNGPRGNSTADRSASGAGTPAKGPAEHQGPDPTTANRGGGAAGTTAERPHQPVTLVGCLRGPDGGAATGTAGTRDRSGSAVQSGDARGSVGVYRLIDATPASNDSAGRGAGGAGASGGPLVNEPTTFVLDGVPANSEGSVNKQVRVSGRMDATDTPVGNSSAASSSAAAGGSAAASGSGTTAAGPTDRANAATPQRRLIVESVQVVAQDCGSSSRR